jgi:hypothetical protein
MATFRPEGVWRTEATATKVTGQTQVSPVVMVPEGVIDFTLYVRGSAASTARVEETGSSGAAIAAGTATWQSVDATLDAVGTTPTRFALGARTPVALRVTSLVNDQTGTLIVVGKRQR